MDKAKSPRRIYIRHADKEYANGDATLYKHDPGITDKGIEKAKMVAKRLVEQWGMPDRIIVSPYRRTRETAKVMKAALLEPGILRKIPVNVDRDVSEYLGNHRTAPIDVTESTLTHEPPHPESFSEMKTRVESHNNKITKYIKKHGGVIWIVTHGLIMKQVAYLNGIKMAKEFPNLTCLSISDGELKCNIRGEVFMFHETSDLNSDPPELDEFDNSDDTLSEKLTDNNEKYTYEPRYEIGRSDKKTININRWDLVKSEKKWTRETEINNF